MPEVFQTEPEAHENRKRRRIKSWKPKRWKPEYERMVAMSCLGWSNKMIAKELNYSKEHISVILNMDEAETVRVMVLERMREKTIKSIPEELEYIAKKTVERLKSAIDDDELFEKSPFALIDRGMDVLKGIGHIRGGGNGSSGNVTVNVGQGGNAMVVTTSVADDLAHALTRANEVRALHDGGANELASATPVKVTQTK